MKRVNNSGSVSDGSLPKKLKNSSMDVVMAESGSCSTQDPVNTLKSFLQHGMDVEHIADLVEREASPCNYSLVNSNYVGFMPDIEGSQELSGATATASSLLASNSVSRIDQIGQQMKFLHESLQATLRQTERSQLLHKAACNFVKKPGNVYHLYSRPSGQKYFSMLSPEDWGGNPPHRFLGSWYLGLDQNWTPLEEMKHRNEGITWLQSMSSKFLELT